MSKNKKSEIYDERNAKKIKDEKKEKNKEKRKLFIKKSSNQISIISKEYFNVIKGIFSSNKEAYQTIKEIFEKDTAKHTSFIWILLCMMLLIPFSNLIKSGVFNVINNSNAIVITQGSPWMPLINYGVILILYLLFIAITIFFMELIFSKRKLKIKDLINLLNIKIIVMIFYTFIILLITFFRPIQSEVFTLLASCIMLINLNTSDSLMVKIGKKVGIIRETTNKYLIILHTFLTVYMFIAYYVFLTYI